MVSTPLPWRSFTAKGSEKRETAMIRFSIPAALTAFLARVARVGPILPPAPRIMMSPSILAMSSIIPAEGVVSSWSKRSSVQFMKSPFGPYRQM